MVPMMFKSKYFYKFQLIRTIYNSTAHYLKLIIIIFFIYFTVKKKTGGDTFGILLRIPILFFMHNRFEK